MRIGVVCVIKESWGGSEELWAAMAHEALAAGHEVVVSAYNCGNIHPKMQALINKGVKLVYRRGYVKPGLPVARRVIRKAEIILANKLFDPFKSFLRIGFDVVLYNGTSYTSAEDKTLFPALIHRNIRYCYLAHIAADYYRPLSFGELNIVAKAFGNASQNYFIAERIIKITERQLAAAIPNASVVRNPVNLSSVEMMQLPALDNTIHFAMVGLLVAAHKGQDMAMAALSGPVWKERNWHLNIYGSGVDEQYLKQLSDFYNLQDRVTFHGKVSDIRAVWLLNHILLMPSLMEGTPLALVEAMLCGRPSIVTDVGGHTEWVTDAVEGFVAEAPSVVSIENTIERAWNVKQKWAEIGLQAHNKAISLYDPNAGATFLSVLIRI